MCEIDKYSGRNLRKLASLVYNVIYALYDLLLWYMILIRMCTESDIRWATQQFIYGSLIEKLLHVIIVKLSQSQLSYTTAVMMRR